jgi:hypothetical protein
VVIPNSSSGQKNSFLTQITTNNAANLSLNISADVTSFCVIIFIYVKFMPGQMVFSAIVYSGIVVNINWTLVTAEITRTQGTFSWISLFFKCT